MRTYKRLELESLNDILEMTMTNEQNEKLNQDLEKLQNSIVTIE